jgi:hypothetical protein
LPKGSSWISQKTDGQKKKIKPQKTQKHMASRSVRFEDPGPGASRATRGGGGTVARAPHPPGAPAAAAAGSRSDSGCVGRWLRHSCDVESSRDSNLFIFSLVVPKDDSWLYGTSSGYVDGTPAWGANDIFMFLLFAAVLCCALLFFYKNLLFFTCSNTPSRLFDAVLSAVKHTEVTAAPQPTRRRQSAIPGDA